MDKKYKITFTCQAELGRDVLLYADFLNWHPVQMKDLYNNGLFKYSHELMPGRYRYYYSVDGNKVLDKRDPQDSNLTGYTYSLRTVYTPEIKAVGKKNIQSLQMRSLLESCRSAGEEGYKIASENLQHISNAINHIVCCINEIKGIDSKEASAAQSRKEINDHLTKVRHEFESLPDKIREELERLKEFNEAFNIVIFGKTMNGKSTMMEILTHGNGDSIGLGRQRTTRDVRAYYWNGIKVTDVPGICAAGGEDDSEVAYEATKSADLVVFLITDDSPCEEEARFFNKIRSQGKPIIGVVNVRLTVDVETPEDAEDFLYDLEKKMKGPHCINVESQFNEYLHKISSGPSVHFIPVHLAARFHADLETDPVLRKKLADSSNFFAFEKSMKNIIKYHGPTYRLKTFMDLIIKPLQDFSEKLFEQNEICRQQGKILCDKFQQLKRWKEEEFYPYATREIDAFVDRTIAQLQEKIPEFCEQYCQSENAGSAWNDFLNSYNIAGKCKFFCRDNLLKRLQNGLNNFQQELSFEISFSLDVNGILSETPTDYKKMWNWGGNLLSSGLGIAAVCLGSGPLGWIAAGVGLLTYLGSFFFDDYGEKLKKARAEMEVQLNSQMHDLRQQIRSQLFSFLHEQLLGTQEQDVQLPVNNLSFFDVFRNSFGDNFIHSSCRKSKNQEGVFRSVCKSLNKGTAVIFSMADKQRQLGASLNKQIQTLNYSVVSEILRNSEYVNWMTSIASVGRIPGKITLLLLHRSVHLPQEVFKILGQALKETVIITTVNANLYIQICNILKIRANHEVLSLDEEKRIAGLKQYEDTPELHDRVRLAQQITGVYIHKKKKD